MSKIAEVYFRPEWDASMVVELPESIIPGTAEAEEYIEDHINNMSDEELLQKIHSALEGGIKLLNVKYEE